ncbi:MAG: hypothetical protein Q7R76_00370 [Candidatus Woesearchaeota archaeon]|nr:hypothetical protein [Candidatus Woesearchaeota archaeon]
MAQPAKVQRTIDVWKKKRWYKLIAPALFNNEILGETPSLEPVLVEHRTVSANLMTLTRDMKKQHIDVTFEVERVQGDSAFTDVKRYEINPAFIKRSVRRNRSRVDDSFTCITADGWELQVKPFLLTRFATPRSIETALRRKAKEFIVRAVSKNSKDTILRDVISMKLQRLLRDSVKNIYNLRACEIRVLDVIGKTTKKPLVIPDEKPVLSDEEREEKESDYAPVSAPEPAREVKEEKKETMEPAPAADSEDKKQKKSRKKESSEEQEE